MAQFKIKCSRCKVNFVLTTAKNSYGASCFECNKKEMDGEIKDPAMKKLFDIPEEYYKNSGFLRSIKINYLKYGNLSEKQLEIFKKVVNDLNIKNQKTEVLVESKPKKAVAKKK